MKLIMCKGLPASGKSTWAKEQAVTKLIPQPSGKILEHKVVRVNKDDIRIRLNKPFSYDLEKEVLRIRDFEICQALSKGWDVISDDTNFAPKHETRLRELAKKYKAEFEVKFFDTPLDECLRRNSLREDETARVPYTVIMEMYEKYLRTPQEAAGGPIETPVAPIPYVADPSLPTAILCDLDGTLALAKGRGPYEHSRCDKDEVNTPVLEVVYAMLGAGFDVIFMSGRDEIYRPQTQTFLTPLKLETLPLYMRSKGDRRKDNVIKGELYDAHIKGKFNVLFCLDDRQQVVDFYRSIGLTVFQVAPGNF